MTAPQDKPQFFACSRCGSISIPRETAQQRTRRNTARATCLDCSATRKATLAYGDIICKPWSGEIDLDSLIPLKNGFAYLPGIRLCGHSDCVEESHIDGFGQGLDKELLAEQLDISYRTGIKKDYESLIKAARREGALHGLLHAKS
jgi:hypothetical protein